MKQFKIEQLLKQKWPYLIEVVPKPSEGRYLWPDSVAFPLAQSAGTVIYIANLTLLMGDEMSVFFEN